MQDAYKEKPWFIVVPDNLVFTYVWRPIRFLLLVWAATVVPVVVSFVVLIILFILLPFRAPQRIHCHMSQSTRLYR